MRKIIIVSTYTSADGPTPSHWLWIRISEISESIPGKHFSITKY
jgi:hypothetical protein